MAPADAATEGRVDDLRDPFDARFAGSRFGNVLHDALEHVAFDAWRDWRDGDTPPPGEDAPLRTALRAGGYPDADLEDGVALLAGLVGHTLVAPLPEGGRLCDLAAEARRRRLSGDMLKDESRLPGLENRDSS